MRIPLIFIVIFDMALRRAEDGVKIFASALQSAPQPGECAFCESKPRRPLQSVGVMDRTVKKTVLVQQHIACAAGNADHQSIKIFGHLDLAAEA